MKIRSVHPEFFTDPKISELDPQARLLYIGLWCFADDWGRGRYLPKTIEGEVFPRDVVDITRLLWELERRRFIRLYESGGERFYEIPKWEEWQKPKHYGKTRIPEPETYVSTEDFTLSETFGKKLPERAHGEGEGEGEGEVAAAVDVGDGFGVFHRERAAAEYQRRGKPALKSKSGYIKSIADDPEFTEESRRIWGHRECETCKGSGFRTFYSPGSGAVDAPCEVLS